MEIKLPVCKNCEQEIKSGRYHTEEGLCGDCYDELITYRGITYPTPKKTVSGKFYLDRTKAISPIELLMKMNEFESALAEKTKAQAFEQGWTFVQVFREFDITQKMEELIQNGKIELTASYYFFNNILDSVTCFEDRNKHRNVYWKKDSE